MNMGFISCLILAVAITEVVSELGIQYCTPGTVRQDACGPCYCNDIGSEETCLNQYCISSKSSISKRFERAARIGRRCSPGQTFMIDCNVCTCPSNGFTDNAACTLMACPPGNPPPRRLQWRG